MDNPYVTVLMTVYNAGGYLRTAIDSLLHQTFRDFEVLIIDDGSTDGALDAVKALNDPRIRIHHNVKNLGQTASLNLGLSMAKGDLVARMDADDMAYPNWLKVQVEFMQQHPDCAVVSCKAVVMDESGHIYKKLRTPDHYADMVLKSFFATPINHVGCMFRREAIMACGKYDETLRIAADYDLWSRLLRKDIKICSVPTVGVAIRAHRHSVTAVHKGGQDVGEVCGIMGDNIHHFISIHLDQKQLKALWAYVYAPASLTESECLEANSCLENIYGKAKGKLDGVQGFWDTQRKIFFVNALAASSGADASLSAGPLLNAGIKKHGFWSFYGLCWVLTLGGSVCGVWRFMLDTARKLQYNGTS